MGTTHFSGPVESENGFIGQTFGDSSTYVADGSISITDKLALLDADDNTVVATLADGAEGQVLRAKAINVDNLVTLQPTNFFDGTIITFGSLGQYVTLVFDGTNWNVTSGNATVS